jgi:integrase
MFPASFAADIECWKHRVADPDPFDDDAPARALRPATVEHRVFEFRMLASALVQSGTVEVDQIVDLSVLMIPKNFEAALRWHFDAHGQRKTQQLHGFAKAMILVARHFVRVRPEDQQRLAKLASRLDPKSHRGMTDKNRERLRAFDDPALVRSFLTIHRKLRDEARKLLAVSPTRAARLMERAVIFGIQTRLALRSRSLRELDLRKNLICTGSGQARRLNLYLAGDNVKTGNPLEFELSPELADLIGEHLRDYRPLLPNSDSSWLFPGATGKPRSSTSMSVAVVSTARTYLGITLNPHLFRHALAKIMIENDPGSAILVQRLYGHTTLDTSYAHYLGTETKAAGRHIDTILEESMGGS